MLLLFRKTCFEIWKYLFGRLLYTMLIFLTMHMLASWRLLNRLGSISAASAFLVSCAVLAWVCLFVFCPTRLTELSVERYTTWWWCSLLFYRTLLQEVLVLEIEWIRACVVDVRCMQVAWSGCGFLAKRGYKYRFLNLKIDFSFFVTFFIKSENELWIV